MSEKREGNRAKYKKVKPDMDSLFESDEHFGFIVGYTSNGVHYGLTHEEMEKTRDDIKNETTAKPNVGGSVVCKSQIFKLALLSIDRFRL